jgi:cyclopropane-fatty-acyl-phospholipid synthase
MSEDYSSALNPPRWLLPVQVAGLARRGSTARRLVLGRLSGITAGTLDVTLPEGSSTRFQGRDASGPQAAMTIHDPQVFRRLLTGGAIAFAECYIEGLWDTPDLPTLLDLLHRNEATLRAGRLGSRITRLLNRGFHRSRNNSRDGSRRNIAYHYDLGNDFYAAWLDPGMTYSAARYLPGCDTLQQAQDAKYRRIAELAGLRGDQRVLEIGCGWGGFMEHASGLPGCRVDGITLSREQLTWTNHRLQQLGLAAQASASLTDYRDTTGSYDAVVSIEMLEAVGREHWPAYFRTLHQRLKPGGAAVIQVITIDESRYAHYLHHTDFIQRYIFPGGMLPTPEIVCSEAGEAGLQVEHCEMFGLDYARTLSEWRRNFHAAWPRIRQLGFDEPFRRLWDYYLCYCETGFRSGSIDVGIFRFRKPG